MPSQCGSPDHGDEPSCQVSVALQIIKISLHAKLVWLSRSWRHAFMPSQCGSPDHGDEPSCQVCVALQIMETNHQTKLVWLFRSWRHAIIPSYCGFSDHGDPPSCQVSVAHDDVPSKSSSKRFNNTTPPHALSQLGYGGGSQYVRTLAPQISRAIYPNTFHYTTRSLSA